MPSRLPCIPKHRQYKAKDLAVVRIHDHDLGRFGSEERKGLYRRLLPELLPASGTIACPNLDREPILSRLMVAYWDRHIITRSVKDGRPTSERDNIRQAPRFA